MKTKNSFLLLSSLLLAVRFVPTAAAQDTAPTTTPAVSQPSAPDSERHERIAPGDREKFKAAREKAMQDPKVKSALENMKAANEAFRTTRRQALLAQDPSLGPVLDKVDAAMKQNPPGKQGGEDAKAGPRERGAWRMEAALNTLTPEEREKLKAAHQKIKGNPEFVAAQEKRREAGKQFASALHDAMLAADPTIEPLLKKREEARRNREPRHEVCQPPTNRD